MNAHAIETLVHSLQVHSAWSGNLILRGFGTQEFVRCFLGEGGRIWQGGWVCSPCDPCEGFAIQKKGVLSGWDSATWAPVSRAKKLLENIQGPRPRLIEWKLAVIKLAEVARPGVEEFHPVPLANVEKVLVGASAPGELAGGLWVELKGSFACFPLPEGVVVKILKAKGSRGMVWGHEAPKIQEVREVEGPGYSLPLWRAEKRRAGITLAEERGLPSAPKEVRLLLAAAPAACGTEPRKLIAWAEGEKARLVAEKASRATKKGARSTGLSAGPEPLTKGELYRATRWLKRQVRACRIERKAKERAAKMAARERQALIEAAEKLLWSQVDSPSGFGTDKTRAAGQTQLGRVWTGNRRRERVHA